MTAANPLRGEARLRLPAGEVRLRPSFARLCAAEAELGSLLALVERAGEGDARLSELIALLWHCADGPELTREAFCDAALAMGAAELTPAVAALFKQILSGC